MDNQYKSIESWQKIFPESKISYHETGLDDILKKPCWTTERAYALGSDFNQKYNHVNPISVKSEKFSLYSGIELIAEATILKPFYIDGMPENRDTFTDVSRYPISYLIYTHFRSIAKDITHVVENETYIGSAIDDVYSKTRVYEFRFDEKKITKESDTFIRWAEESAEMGSWAEWPEDDDPNTPGQGI